MKIQHTFKTYILATCSFLAVGALTLSSIANAGTVEVALNFDKRPAKFGVAYIYDESAPALNGVVDQADKKFIDGIVPVSPNTTLTFKNSDAVDHNIFANELSDDFSLQFDIGLMPVDSEQELKVDWKNGTLVRVGCKIHPKMKAYIANIKAKEFNIFEFQKKTKDYSASLTSTTDTAQVKVLLDRYDPVSIAVAPGESQTIDLIKKGKKKGTATISHQ